MQFDPWKDTSRWKLIDGIQLQPNTHLETEVVVIGSGAGGGVSAEILAAAGRKVILVEEGPLRTARHFDMKEATAYPTLYQETASRKTKNKAITILQGRCVGGSTTVNWTSSFRTPPQTLSHWQQNYSVKDTSPSTLEPWFKQMEAKLNIEPWVVPPNPNNQLLKTGADQLGWHTGIMARNVKGCWNLGYCGVGCPTNAKLSMLVTTIPAALEKGTSLLFNTQVQHFLWKSGQATTLICKTASNQIIQIKAHTFVLCAGSIGTPALLLRSKAPDPYQLVGKRTFLHPTVASLAITPDRVDAYQGVPQSAYSDEFLWNPEDVTAFGFKLEVPPLHPVLVSTLLPFHGTAHYEVMQKFPYFHVVIALGRDGFHRESRGGGVLLRKDGSPVLDYPITSYLWNGFRETFLKMAELQFAAGAERVMPVHVDAHPYKSWRETKEAILNLPMEILRTVVMSAHVMGGCPMGENPKQAVVSSFGQHHQLENVFVFDGSVFPTSLGVNPQLSIYALAARNANLFLKSAQPP